MIKEFTNGISWFSVNNIMATPFLIINLVILLFTIAIALLMSLKLLL